MGVEHGEGEGRRQRPRGGEQAGPTGAGGGHPARCGQVLRAQHPGARDRQNQGQDGDGGLDGAPGDVADERTAGRGIVVGDGEVGPADDDAESQRGDAEPPGHGEAGFGDVHA